MKTINKIQIPTSVNHISDFTNELPKNCLFDKGITGCGGTTLAITNNENYVICVPFVNLIDCKIAKHSELLGVKAGISVTDIRNYIKETEVIKIMVTYDSLDKVISALGDKVNEVNLLVDELHLLFNQYTFRKEAINKVLRSYTAFKSYCFMTATPLKEKYTLKELKDIDVVRYEWNKVTETTVNSVKCENVEATVCAMINQHLENECNDNLYFFINSIEFINSVCRMSGLDNENARMICSKDNTAKKALSISSINSNPKKINFITSTAFEGCDLYDELGRTIIISEGSKTHTLVDISTSMVQICGRIRNSRYNDSVYHLYSSTRYTDVTVEEHQKRTEEGINKANHLLKEYSKVDEVAYKAIKAVDSLYLFKNENDEWFFDENAVLIDMWNFEMCNGIYSFRSRLNDEYEAKGFDVVEGSRFDEKIKMIDEAITKTKEFTFKDFVQEIKAEEERCPHFNLYLDTIKDIAFKKYSFLKEAIEKVGFGKMGTLKYSQVAIKKELIAKSNDSENTKAYKVSKLLSMKAGDFFTNKELKEKITSIYKALDIKKTAKAGDITEWFEVKQSKRRIDGKQVDGYTIIRSKIIFKQSA